MSQDKSKSSVTEKGELTDPAECSFLVGQATFVAKKSVLVMHSEVFDRMFNGHFQESTASNIIRLTDVESADFKKFLDYLHDQDASKLEQYTIETLKSLFYLGTKYMIKPIQEACRKSITSVDMNKLNNFDLLSIFQFAHQMDSHQMDISSISNLLKILDQRVRIQVHIIYSSCIYDWDLPIFHEFLKTIKPYVPDSLRFNMIELYAMVNNLEADYSIKKQHTYVKARVIKVDQSMLENNDAEIQSTTRQSNMGLDMLLHQIDYSKMTSKEFYAGPGSSKVIKLDTAEKYEMLAKLANCKTV